MLKIAWNKSFCHGLPEGHRFPMDKYNLLPEQLKYEGTLAEENFFDPAPALEKYILGVHDKTYLEKLKNLGLSRKEERATGFPLSAQLVQRELEITGGTIQCVQYALEHGVSGNIAGGTHHSFRDRGEGFCLLNDIAVGSYFAMSELGMERILVVDLDVHQGNGTAAIFEHEQRVFTFSMHGAKNYPLHKEKSDLDIGLPDKTEDEEYLKILRETLPQLIEDQNPELLFFQSGVDVLATDKLGRLGMTVEGCRQRDVFVFEQAKNHSIPVVFNMGGGYSEKIATIVDAHANTFRSARNIFF